MAVVGIIGLDVGVTTGWASGLFNPELRDRTSLWKAVARGRRPVSQQIGGRDVHIRDGAMLVAKAVAEQIYAWHIERGIPKNDIYVIVEDFQVRKDLRGGTARDKLAPVYVAGFIDAELVSLGFGSRLFFISASLSKSKATDARLKLVGKATNGRVGWVRGKPHCRDAWRLVATGLDKEVV